MITIGSEKWRHANCGVVRVIVCELGEWQEGGPVRLLKVAKRTHIVLDSLVCALGLAIGLWVKGSGKVGAGTKKACDFPPPSGGEGCASVGDNISRKPVRAVDVGNELLGEDCGGISSAGGNEVGEFGKAANNDKNGVRCTAGLLKLQIAAKEGVLLYDPKR